MRLLDFRRSHLKVLFLDIDGVLNCRRSAVAFKGYPHPGRSKGKFDRVAVELIRRICKKGVNIVLSSTWRLDENYKGICQLPIIDRTPRFRLSPGVDRGREIEAWLNDHKAVKKWAIVDDDSDMLPEQKENFVHVDGINGLLWQDYEKLCTILDVEI